MKKRRGMLKSATRCGQRRCENKSIYAAAQKTEDIWPTMKTKDNNARGQKRGPNGSLKTICHVGRED